MFARRPVRRGVSPRQYRLTKTRYLTGLNCPKALWLSVHDPQKATPPSAFQEHIMRQGTEIGILATERFPGGVRIEVPSYQTEQALQDTRHALASGAPALYEGAFLFLETLVRVDILRRDEAGAWDLVEVKSTTQVKAEHLPDAAVQRFVLEGSGVRLGRVYLMHLNPECLYPDLSDLFRMEDVTEQIGDVLVEVEGNLASFLKLLRRRSVPEAPVGPQCTEPYHCAFHEHCWKNLPPVSVFNIPRLSVQAKTELAQRNIVAIEDLPADFALPPVQRRFVDLYLAGRALVDWGAIREELAALEFPLRFLDFETDNPAVPRFAGLHPYGRIPFQYSCHVLQADGSLRHSEYLQGQVGDPRPPLARSLEEALGGEGRVVAYNAAFEKGVLLELAEHLATEYPLLSARLEAGAGRLWDLLEIFRNFYLDPAFGGSNSLKNVLPVLLPQFSYSTMEVQNGEEAQLAWERLIELPEGPPKRRLEAALRAYCRLDSLAMVEIYRQLKARADKACGGN
jgi:hypothetical protein